MTQVWLATIVDPSANNEEFRTVAGDTEESLALALEEALRDYGEQLGFDCPAHEFEETYDIIYRGPIEVRTGVYSVNVNGVDFLKTSDLLQAHAAFDREVELCSSKVAVVLIGPDGTDIRTAFGTDHSR